MSSNETNTPQQAFIYARVSSDLQSEASIEDQLRMCKERAAKEGCELLGMQVRFPPDVHQWLRAQAERNMSSINAEIIRCVRDAMDRQVDRQVPCTTPPHDRSGNGS
jgi:predicted HicB family RNase H-like nuclease